MELGVPLPWFFIIARLFIVHYVDVIVFECYPGWLPSKTCWPSKGYFSFVWENLPDFGSVGFTRYCCCCCSIHWYISRAVLWCGALFLSCWVSSSCLFRSRRPFFIRGSFKKVSHVYHIIIHVCFQIFQNTCFSKKRELDLGSLSKFLATLASHNVALCSVSLISSSKLRFLREGGVTNSIGGIFSLSELKQSGSSNILGLYSCSVGLGHSPESEVTLVLFFLGVKTPESFWGTCFPSLTCFFYGGNFSVCFSMSSTNVWFPVWVLTFKIRSIVSSGKSQVKKPFLKSHWEFSNLAIVI